MRRILLVLSVAALMAVMLVAMAMPAFAERPFPPPEANPPLGPPAAGGDRDCDGGKNNANHALNLSSPSWDASAIDNPSRNGDANRAEPAGLGNALDSLEIGECRN